jgi:hypothetical protein
MESKDAGVTRKNKIGSEQESVTGPYSMGILDFQELWLDSRDARKRLD